MDPESFHGKLQGRLPHSPHFCFHPLLLVLLLTAIRWLPSPGKPNNGGGVDTELISTSFLKAGRCKDLDCSSQKQPGKILTLLPTFPCLHSSPRQSTPSQEP